MDLIRQPHGLIASKPVVRFWTEEQALLWGAERFLTRLIAHSKEFDPDADDPDVAPVKFDDLAMVEAWAEMGGGDVSDQDA